MKWRKEMKLNPNENGNFPCPYCGNILTAIFKEWLQYVTDYICHRCQKGFKVRKEEEGILRF